MKSRKQDIPHILLVLYLVPPNVTGPWYIPLNLQFVNILLSHWVNICLFNEHLLFRWQSFFCWKRIYRFRKISQTCSSSSSFDVSLSSRRRWSRRRDDLSLRLALSKHLKCRLGPRVCHEMFFAPKEVGWGPVFVTQRFLHQRRLVGALCSWRNVFWFRGGRLGPCVRHAMFFTLKEVGWGPVFVTQCFLH